MLKLECINSLKAAFKMKKFLSANELREGRNLPRNLPEKGGCKSVVYDDLREESVLRFVLDDRKRALQEPKVEKLSSLIKGEWLPGEKAVRILKNVGKHLQHMGFTMDTDRALYPEEALFLMDVKCMEVFYKNIPLSMQEGYNLFLISAVDILRYQVYSHLSRLGYIVVRHQGRSGLTSYERKIGLDKYLRREKDNLSNESVANCTSNEIVNIQLDSSDDDEPIECTMETEPNSIMNKEEPTVGSNYNEGNMTESATAFVSIPCLLARHKDIVIPNAYGKTLFALLSASRSLLPPGVELRKEMYIIDLTKLYLQSNMPTKEFHCHRLRQSRIAGESLSHRFVEQLSWHKEQEACKRRKCAAQPSTKQRFKKNRNQKRQSGHSVPDAGNSDDVVAAVNHVTETHTAKVAVKPVRPTSGVNTKARTWKQYKAELSRKRSVRSATVQVEVSRLSSKSQVKTGALSWKEYKAELAVMAEVEKFSCLSTATCKPLIALKDTKCTASVLQKLQIIPQVMPKQDSISLSQQHHTGKLLEIVYDVYLPSTLYSRNKMMLPNHRLVLTSISDPLPPLDLIWRTVKYLNDDIPLHFAVVDNDNIAFYMFNNVAVPVDVTVG